MPEENPEEKHANKNFIVLFSAHGKHFWLISHLSRNKCLKLALPANGIKFILKLKWLAVGVETYNSDNNILTWI